MLLVRCGHCSQILEIDDAFAGGVCRCKHCKTIQTVPDNVPSAPVPMPAQGGRMLPRAPMLGYGLDEEPDFHPAPPAGLALSEDDVESVGMETDRSSRRRWISIMRLGFAFAMFAGAGWLAVLAVTPPAQDSEASLTEPAEQVEVPAMTQQPLAEAGQGEIVP